MTKFRFELRRYDGTPLMLDIVESDSIVLALFRGLYRYLPDDVFSANELRVAFSSDGQRARARLYPYRVEVYQHQPDPPLPPKLTIVQRRQIHRRKRHGNAHKSH